jgi:hypothetical protein
MRQTGLAPEDFKQLPKDGARFEALICQLLEALGYRILERPAIGTEGGRDVLVERTLKDPMGEKSERVVVQCKHFAHSGRAVGDNDVGVWRNAMARYKARGYLLVTDSRITENLSRSFREFTSDDANAPYWANSWDVDQLISFLNKYTDVRDSFLPLEGGVQTPLAELADEVSNWLSAIHYDVTFIERSELDIRDMLATFEEGTIKQQVLIRCVDGEISSAHVDELDSLLNRNTPQGWLIGDKRVSKNARTRAQQIVSIRIFNLSEFLQQLIWGKYFAALGAQIERERISNLYVDLGCYKLETDAEGREIGRDPRDMLDDYIDEWLAERGKMHMSILGDFGAGKTWFCLHYADRQLNRFLRDPVKQRLPLLITLRMFAKAMTAQQLINDALLEQYELPFVGSAYDIFQQMNKRGKLLLILDGFDEMARQVDYQTVVDNFWELARLAQEHSKLILTSRTEYFRWAKESEKILRGEEYGRRTIVLEPPKFEVLYLQPFSEDQIREVIVRRLGGEAGQVAADRVLRSEALREMASKPVLVELLLTALDQVRPDLLETQAQVYLYATNKILLRNISAEKTFTSTADKLYFLCELAWEMLRSTELRIHYTILPDRITSYFGDRIKDRHELDNWDFDLRTQTLLHRDAAGYYEFAHRSLAEYFVAFKFAAELDCLDPSFATTYCDSDGQPCQIPITPKDTKGLQETFGSLQMSNMRMIAVRDLLIGMVSGESSKLWQVIEETKRKTTEEVGYVGGNAVSLLLMKQEKFDNRKLSNAVLNGVDLAGKDLKGIDLRGAILHTTSLRFSDLRRSDLTDVSLDEGSLVAADLRDAKGLEPRFFRYASESIPRVDYLKGREPEISKINNFLNRQEPPGVAIIHGLTGMGKSSLMASVARQLSLELDRPICWYQRSATVARVGYWDDLRFYDHLYEQIATFMTVAGHNSLAQFLAKRKLWHKAKKDKARTKSAAEVIRQINLLILPAFQQERWLICIDDVSLGRDEPQLGFLLFFAQMDISTKIIVTTQVIPEELARHVAVIELAPWKS